MFASREDALRQLSGSFDADTAGVFAKLLRSHIGFEADPATTRIGTTRMGGTPDLPVHIAWPIREVPENVGEIAGFGGSNHAAHIRQHLEQPLPYAFIAQIDLAEASRALPTGNRLPGHGRLLFFCDLQVVPWRDGIESCRVIWDDSSADALSNAGTPPVVQRLAEESLAELRAEFEKHGLDTEGLSHSYWGVSRPMRLKCAYALPDAGAPEAQDDTAFVALMDDEDTADAYSDFVSEIAHDRAAGIERHRMLGNPLPEQGAPRFTAVAMVDYGRTRFWEWPDRPEMTEIETRMKAWHLLLQCDLSDFYQDRLSEGTVYFLIRDDDLRARHFYRTVVVYQQT
jgi:Domain of unknown function (DUF1963)